MKYEKGWGYSNWEGQSLVDLNIPKLAFREHLIVVRGL